MKAILSVASMKKLISSTKKFVNNNSSSGIMQYIKIEVANGTVTAIALDGHRISKEKVNCENDESFTCFIKPVLPVTKGSIYSDIELIGDYAYITVGDYRVGFKQPEGKFYETDKYFIPNEYDTFSIGVNATKLKEVLESMQKNSLRKDCVVLRFKGPKDAIYIENVGKDVTSQRILLPMSCAELSRYKS